MTEYVKVLEIGKPSVLFIESFGNFKSVDGMMLPHSYTLNNQFVDGSDATARFWSIEVEQISHDEAIDPQIFHAK
jgi:hypothetical protein